MLRGLLDAILLFLVPFVAYAAYLAVRRRFAATLYAWGHGPVLRLVVAGLALAVAGTLLAGILNPRHQGDYVPAHIQNGVLVPGRME